MKSIEEDEYLNASFARSAKLLAIGAGLLGRGMYEDAIQATIKSLTEYFHNEMGHLQLATALQKSGETRLALEQIDRAIPFFPGYLPFHYIKHELLWLLSDRRGLTEHRRKLVNLLNFDTSACHIDGKNILITADEFIGYGDFIQYARCLKYFARRARSVTIECGDAFDGVKFLHGMPVRPHSVDRRDFDMCIPISQLLFFVGDDVLEDGPSEQYVQVESSYLEKWDCLIPPYKKPRIGLCWHGAIDHLDQDRFLNSVNLRSLLSNNAYEFFSLQKNPDHRYTCNEMMHKYNDLTRQINTFGDTAALIDRLDAVISVDTSVAHLAAAMGKPTIVMRPSYQRPAWLPDDRGWYKSATVFSMDKLGWSAVVSKVAVALPALV